MGQAKRLRCTRLFFSGLCSAAVRLELLNVGSRTVAEQPFRAGVQRSQQPRSDVQESAPTGSPSGPNGCWVQAHQ